MLAKMERFYQQGADFLVSPPSRNTRWLTAIWLALLFLGGNLLWVRFLNWGQEPYMYHDWSQITGPRLTFLQNAMREGVLPLHAGNTGVFTGDSARFMSTADVILSPQVILLRFLDLGPFVVLQTCLMFSLGYLGLLRIRSTQRLSILAFTVAFLLYFFSGHIVDHLSVGHLSWGGYFLLTWYIYLVMELLAGRKGGWSWILQMSVFMLVLLLQGSYHQFAWSICFLLMLALVQPRHFRILLGGIIFSTLAGLFRLLPPVLNAGELHTDFMGGYHDLLHLVTNLVVIQQPDVGLTDPWTLTPVGQWEFSLYVGVTGAVFLLFFGLYKTIRYQGQPGKINWLLLPGLGMIFLSFSRVYKVIYETLSFPPFNGERNSARMASMAFIFLVILAAIQFQKWLDRRRINGYTLTLLLAGLVFMGYELILNYLNWQVTAAYQAFDFLGYTKTQWFVQNDFNDTPYINLILGGLAMTIATLAFLAFMASKEKRKSGSSPDLSPALEKSNSIQETH